VKDLAASRQFYEALGMEVIDELPDLRVVVKSGYFRLALMTFPEENSLNFRGADDIFSLHAAVSKALPGVEGAPWRRAPDHENGEGESWLTRDPDGNLVFFDMGSDERGEAYNRQRIAEILADTESELQAFGASAECLQAFRDVLTNYAPASSNR
jgi:hypothetical protein